MFKFSLKLFSLRNVKQIMIIGLLAASNISNASGFSELGERFVHAITSRVCPHRSHREPVQQGIPQLLAQMDQETQTDKPMQITKEIQTDKPAVQESVNPQVEQLLPTLEDLIEQPDVERRREMFENLMEGPYRQAKPTIDEFMRTQEYLDMATFENSVSKEPLTGITLERGTIMRDELFFKVNHKEFEGRVRYILNTPCAVQKPNGDILKFSISLLENQELRFSVLMSEIPKTHALHPVYCTKFSLPKNQDLEIDELVDPIIENPELLDQIINEELLQQPNSTKFLGTRAKLPHEISFAAIVYNSGRYWRFVRKLLIQVDQTTEEEREGFEREGIQITDVNPDTGKSGPRSYMVRIYPRTPSSRLALKSLSRTYGHTPHFIAMTKALEKHGFPRGDDLGSESAESPHGKDSVQDSGVEQA